jgi:CHAT domain-containing protein/tetratricopeptide (TPR) repeat protein
MPVHRFALLAFLSILVLGPRAFGQFAATASDDLGAGIVVEKIVKNSTAEKAGLRVGDVLLSWSRGDHRGVFESPFDLVAVETEERSQGNIRIRGLRQNSAREWVLGPESWYSARLATRPNFSAAMLSLYRRAKQSLQANRAGQARKLWREMAAENADSPWLYAWLLFHSAELLDCWKRGSENDQLLREASEAGRHAGAVVRASVQRLWACRFECRGKPLDAVLHYQQALEIDLETGSESLALAADLSGLASASRSHPDDFRRYVQQAITIQEKIAPASFALAHSFGIAGELANLEGDLAKAEDYVQRALSIQQKLAPSSPDLTVSLVFLGAFAWERGDFPKAEDYYRQALFLEKSRDPRSAYLALAVDGLSSIAWLRGDLPRAEYYERQALAIWRRSLRNLEVGKSLDNLAGIAYDSGDLAKSEKYNLKALQIVQRVAPGSLELAALLNSRALLLLATGRPERAAIILRQALAINQQLAPSGPFSGSAFDNLGDLYSKTGDLDKAEKSYRGALAIWEKTGPGTTAQSETLASLAKLMGRRHRWDEALNLYAQALDALEMQTNHLGGGSGVRTGFRSHHQDVYRQYADLLMQQHQTERAFDVLERSRARSLVEMLSGGQIDVHKGADPVLLELQRSLRLKLADKSNYRIHLLTEAHNEDQIKALDKEIAALLSQREDLDGQIRSASPAYAALTQPQPLSAKEVQEQLLDPDTLLLEYSLGQEHSYLFTLTSTTLNSYELPGRKKIERVARRLHALLAARNFPVRGETRGQRQARLRLSQQAYLQVTAELSRMILAPAAKELEGKRLLVVTDGALAYVPFAILPRADGVPLIAVHEIVNLPSASALALLRQQEQARARPVKAVAVLADPVFVEDDPRVSQTTKVKASHGQNLKAAEAQSIRTASDSFEADLPGYLLQRSIDDVKPSGRLHLNRLPFTRQEAEAIAATVPADQGLEALDFQASRATATSPDLAQYRIVHFATHGLLDSRHPELSGLVLSLVDAHGRPQNGFLQLQDIYNLNLAADLVVLSACETGLGKEVDGEGLVGLTRGFMYAGASRVMASLWRVDDEATAQLMKKFYEGLFQRGESPAQALRKAQLWMQGQRQWKQPYYWAGFVLQGEWR